MSLDNTAKISDIITTLQNLEGINQKADLKSALVAKGISVADTASIADMINIVNSNLYAHNIKNIQRGKSSLSSGDTLVTISPVDLNKTYLNLPSRESWSMATGVNLVCSIQNTNTLKFSLDATLNPTISWEVIEFSNGIKSIQRGIYTSSTNGTNTITVSAIDPNKAITNIISSKGGSDIYGRIISSTEVEFYKKGSSPFTISWEVIEFN